MMKFLSTLWLMPLALTLGFAACDDDPSDTPTPTPDEPTPVAEVVPDGTVLLHESLRTSLGTLTNQTTAGVGAWRTDYESAYASGYDNSTRTTTAGTYYLVSSAIDLTNVKQAHVSYDYLLRYDRGEANQRLLITATYTGQASTTSWTELNRKHSQSSDYNTFYTADIDIPAAFLGREVRIALYYNAPAAACSNWEVRDLKVTAGKASAGSSTEPATPSLPAVDRASVIGRLETPALKTGNLLLIHNVEYNGDSVMNYCLEYDTTKMHSRWVAFRFDGLTRISNTGRSDAWADDPQLPAAYRIGTLTFPGYSRGHLCASADRVYSAAANKQTFYMTNMSPQLSAFNEGLWLAFEQHVQTLGRDANFADTLYVVKGGTIDDAQTLGDLQRAGNLFVAIPKFYWMALLSVKDGRYSALGFWAEHKSHSADANATRTERARYAVSIDELEQRTGIDFFHNLPDDIEQAVESTLSLTEWNLQ